MVVKENQEKVYVCIYPTPLPRTGCDIRSIFKQSTTGLNSGFSFSLTGCHSKVKEPKQLYYLLIVGGRIVGFIPFTCVFALCEMQTALSMIWTWAAVSISRDENH